MKTYIGQRPHGPGSGIVFVQEEGSPTIRRLNPRWDIRNHSPDGFEWGYGGSGPAQLALAICCDHLQNDVEAQKIYMDFKFRVIAGLREDSWKITSADVDKALSDIRTLLNSGGK